MKKRQKFERFCKCRLLEEWGGYPKGTEVIILGSYNDEYGGGNVKDYDFAPIVRGKVVNKCAWVDEGGLALVAHRDFKYVDMVSKYDRKHPEE